MLHLGRTWKQGVQVLRVDWPVYPRRAEHTPSPREGIEDEPSLTRRPEPNRVRPEAIHVMATAQEKEEMRQGGGAGGSALSIWVRALGLKEARRLTKQG
jgi:hypothetical protein